MSEYTVVGLLRVLLSLWVLLLSLPLAAERVVLQLKWDHEFQFAGYYAAQSQGYYRDAGLEVEIRSAFDRTGRFTDPQAALVRGEADFAIGGSDILVGRDRGHPLVIVAPIFQKSPAALVTLADRSLRSLRDLAGLRIAVNPEDYIAHDLKALLGTRLTRHESPSLVDEPLTLETLQRGRADVLLTYEVSAREAAREAATELKVLPLAQSESTFYGDTLYTHQRLVERSPDTVRRFRDASLRGWMYAMANREAMIDEISTLPRHALPYHDIEAYNSAFARKTVEYLFYPHMAVGLNDEDRWRRNHKLMKTAGVVDGDYPGRALFFDGVEQPGSASANWPWVALGIGCVLAILAAMVASFPPTIFGPVLLAALLLPVIWGLETQLKNAYQDDQRRDVWNELATYRLKLEDVINRNFSLLRGVVGMIASEPDIDQRRFGDFVGSLIDHEPLLVDIAAAPDLVVRHVYPLAGNEAVVGLDYRHNEVQRPMVELARDSRSMVVAGPLELVQGGQAIVGRAPVFLKGDTLSEGEFWGIVSAPIDFDGLIDEIGLTAPNLGIDIALRHGEQSLASVGARVFFGSGELFQRDPVAMPVSLGAVEWEIAATPRGGWGQFPSWLLWLKPLSVLLVIGLCLGLYLLTRQFHNHIAMSGQLRRSEGILRRVGRIADVGGWELDLRSGAEYVADEVYFLHGMKPVPLIDERPQRWLDYYDDHNRAEVEQRIQSAIHSGDAQHFELLVQDGGRDAVWLRHMIEPVLQEGEVIALQGAVQDISAIRHADATIERQARFDPVTALPNRHLFGERLLQSLQTASASGDTLAVLFIDLDHFKDINDSLGHRAGDALLMAMAGRFSSIVRRTDTVARLGGDEFTVLLDGVRHTRHCADVARKLLEAAQQPVTIGDHQVFTSASIGVSLFPDDGVDVDSLLQHADQAMYAAKNAGRNTVRFFTASMQEDVDRRHNLHVLLASALQNRELDVYYQPIIDTRSGAIAKCEALLRWGSVSPAEFVPLAEETGMIVELGEYVMLKACADLHAVNRETGFDLALAFNKSTREFVEESRVHSSVLDKLRQQALFPNITIEITENLLMQEGPDTVEQLRSLRDAGVKIAIDDFGTGYSSLSYLRKFPVDVVKIDKSFISEIEHNYESRALVKAIISMAHSLKIEVVAEGVETAGQLSILRQLNCRYVQGFYFSPALPRDQLIDYVREFRCECA